MTAARLQLERVESRGAGRGMSRWRRLWLALPRLRRECRVATGVIGLY
jgi:hypothetical protein